MNKTQHLILPLCGLSSRFTTNKPKWLLTHPSGNFMITESLIGLPFESLGNIYLGCRKEQQDSDMENAIKKQFKSIGIESPIHFVYFEETKNQPHTVYEMLKHFNINESFVVKDCDNQFTCNFPDGNFISVVTVDEERDQNLNLSNKSYVTVGGDDIVKTIVEKKVISDKFCCGCYGFNSPDNYIKVFEELNLFDDLYLSHMIHKMILNGEIFSVTNSENYLDWGTQRDWEIFTKTYKTIFIDLDGVLVENSSQYLGKRWGETKELNKNVEFLRHLKKQNRSKIIITTSRKESFRKETVDQLNRLDIPFDDIIFDLFHCQRILINDYAPTNPKPAACSLNLQRDLDGDLEKEWRNI